MANIYADIELLNAKDSSIKPLFVYVLVDMNVKTLYIPDHIAVQLNLEEIEKREVVDNDGKTHIVSYVGPIDLKYEDRSCTTGALVIGDSVLMGAGPMEDMDLVISPSGRSIIVKP